MVKTTDAVENTIEKKAGAKKSTAKKAPKRKTSKKKEPAKQMSEQERREIVLQHIKQLLQTGQKKGCLTYTEIMNVMEEDDLSPEQIDKMYELPASLQTRGLSSAGRGAHR